MNFTPINFILNLKYMFFGMLTIVAVIGAIILATAFMNKMFKED